MKIFRESPTIRAVAIVLSINVFLLGCAGELGPRAASFSGEELFSAVFFGTGPAVASIPVMDSQTKLSDLFEANEPEYQEALIFQDLLVERIKDRQPNFFHDFKSMIGTRDPNRIKSELKVAATAYLDAYKSLTGISNEEFTYLLGQISTNKQFRNPDGTISKKTIKQMMAITNQGASDQESCVAVVAVVAIAAIYAAIAVVQWAYVWVDVDIEGDPIQRTSGRGQLFMDQLVLELASL